MLFRNHLLRTRYWPFPWQILKYIVFRTRFLQKCGSSEVEMAAYGGWGYCGGVTLKKWVSGQARERSSRAWLRQKAEIQPETSGNTHFTSHGTSSHLSRAAEFLAFCHFFIKALPRSNPSRHRPPSLSEDNLRKYSL